MKTLRRAYQRILGAWPVRVVRTLAAVCLLTPFLTAGGHAAGEADVIVLPGFGLSEKETAAPLDTSTLKPDASALPEMRFSLPGLRLSGVMSVEHVDEEILVQGLKPITGLVGDATLQFKFTENFALSTSVKRQIADVEALEKLGKFRESVGGAITYYVTPRFELTAGGSIVSTDFSRGVNFDDLSSLPGEASVNATFHFLPFLSGSVNYTYELHDPLLTATGVPIDETTVSFKLIGRF